MDKDGYEWRCCNGCGELWLTFGKKEVSKRVCPFCNSRRIMEIPHNKIWVCPVDPSHHEAFISDKQTECPVCKEKLNGSNA